MKLVQAPCMENIWIKTENTCCIKCIQYYTRHSYTEPVQNWSTFPGWPHKHIPTLSLKTYPWKSLGSSNLLSINYLESLVSACNKCCALLHHNPVWRLTLLHTAKLTQVWFGGTCIWGNPWKGQSWKVSNDSPPWQVFWWRVVWAAHHTGH